MSDPVLALALIAFVCSLFGLWAWGERYLPWLIASYGRQRETPAERRVRALNARPLEPDFRGHHRDCRWHYDTRRFNCHPDCPVLARDEGELSSRRIREIRLR